MCIRNKGLPSRRTSSRSQGIQEDSHNTAMRIGRIARGNRPQSSSHLHLHRQIFLHGRERSGFGRKMEGLRRYRGRRSLGKVRFYRKCSFHRSKLRRSKRSPARFPKIRSTPRMDIRNRGPRGLAGQNIEGKELERLQSAYQVTWSRSDVDHGDLPIVSMDVRFYLANSERML